MDFIRTTSMMVLSESDFTKYVRKYKGEDIIERRGTQYIVKTDYFGY
jgi:hypothetical protein